MAENAALAVIDCKGPLGAPSWGNLGFRTRVVPDANATSDRAGPGGESYVAERVHRMAPLNLHEGEVAIIPSAEALLGGLRER